MTTMTQGNTSLGASLSTNIHSDLYPSSALVNPVSSITQCLLPINLHPRLIHKQNISEAPRRIVAPQRTQPEATRMAGHTRPFWQHSHSNLSSYQYTRAQKPNGTWTTVTSPRGLPSPINKGDLYLPRAIIQAHLSLFLRVSNGRDAIADESQGINYRNHLQGAPQAWFTPGSWKYFSTQEKRISFKRPMARTSSVITGSNSTQ